MPSLILQPLVENAVVHGLAGHQGPVTVRVAVEGAPGTLVLRVDQHHCRRIKPHGADGIGLNNVRERLAVQFAGRAGSIGGAATVRNGSVKSRCPKFTIRPTGAARARARIAGGAHDERHHRRRRASRAPHAARVLRSQRAICASSASTATAPSRSRRFARSGRSSCFSTSR